ncbi:P-loop NTPase fold protein [Streptococcus suis]|uniref:KAP_NTPase n=1 Tax=Streptococcus suis TaxID=1307 RepID=A0A116KDT5_STRSU|nr:P-loop NTPase fold protein [Streptococcus suis]CYU31906.1 KAP_NTPase [Streptococcus suis]CYU92854.1 KAP_NTPase [Streptococcus suis]
MKEKICKKLKELATKPVRRIDWSGERWFVRRYKQGLALGWIIYFLLREELVKEILRPVSSYLMNFSCIQWFYVNRLAFLLVFTFLLFLMKSIFSILRRYKFIRYSLLDEDAYPEYDFPFQEDLVSFLNRKEGRGRNIFWLDGAWGSGKTHFIRTFFENQLYKPREIYYISCFGIRTREQAEKVLIDEIEQHSTFGSLDHIPVVSSLVKWSYKILGLDLMKKHSIVIFDDLERVAYSEKKGDSQEEYTDSPEDYNDLLGFIDHLANHRNQKVLVLMNKEDMGNAYQKIVEEKFKPTVTNIPDQDKIIELVVEKYCDESFVRDFLIELFKLLSCWNSVNLREILWYSDRFKNTKEKIKVLLELLNSNEKIHVFLKNIVSSQNSYQKSFQNSFFQNQLSPFIAVKLFSKETFNETLSWYESTSIPNEKIKKSYDHYSKIIDILWDNNYRNVLWEDRDYLGSGNKNKINGYYTSDESNDVEIPNLLVEIYCDIKNESVKTNYISKTPVSNWHPFKQTILLETLKPSIKVNGIEIGKSFSLAELEKTLSDGNVQYSEDWQAYFASQTNEGDTP